MHGRHQLNEELGRAFVLFPELKALSGNRAGSMSGGQQQMLAIAQALIARPRFLLLDEMSLGLAPVIVERLVDVVRDLRSQGMGILLIEQFTRLALDLADYCHVMARGRLMFSGDPATLANQPEVLQHAYLGT